MSTWVRPSSSSSFFDNENILKLTVVMVNILRPPNSGKKREDGKEKGRKEGNCAVSSNVKADVYSFSF